MDLLDDIFEGFDEYVPTAKSKAVVDNRTPTEKFLDECVDQRKLIENDKAIPTSFKPLEGGKKGERAKDENGKDIALTWKSSWYRASDNTFQVMVGVKALTKRYKGLTQEDAYKALDAIESKANSGALDDTLKQFAIDAKKAAASAKAARAKNSLQKLVEKTNLKASERKRMNELLKEYGHPSSWTD